MLYFSITNKKAWKNAFIGIFFLLGGVASMSYEVYASVASFHQVNVKQEIILKNAGQGIDDPILSSIQEKIDSKKLALTETRAMLKLRLAELEALGPDPDPYAVKVASGRVSANKLKAEQEQADLDGFLEEKTKRLDTVEKSTEKDSSALELVDKSSQDMVNLLIILIPSIMMVAYTPIFAGVAMFGIHVKKENKK